jgi:putative flippase GtrA
MAVDTLGILGRLKRFGAVGVAGFVTDTAILSTLVHTGLDPFSARVISMAVAAVVTWRLNRAFTFGASETSQASEGARYGAVVIASSLINYLLYAGLMLGFPNLIPAIAVAIATAISMWVSYIGYSRIAFQKTEAVHQGGTVFEPYTGVEELHVLADAHNYNRALANFVKAEAREGDTMLDFGAGIGSFSKPVRDLAGRLVCLEPDSHLRDQLRADGFETVPAPAAVENNSVDYAFTLNVLEHIEDDEDAMSELHRMIKPGGRLAVYVPALSWLYTGMDRKVGHWRRYGKRELVEKLERAGFKVHKARFADSLGVPATLAFKMVDDGKGDVSPKSVAIYDKLIFPLSHLIDRLTGGLIGKNLAVYATKV